MRERRRSSKWGDTRRNIYFLVRGSVRVEQHRHGHTQILARLGPGQVFGEISFIDSLGAAASVTADEPTEIERIAGDYVDALIASAPGFATRFYLSIAVTLAGHLRATSELLMPRRAGARS